MKTIVLTQFLFVLSILSFSQSIERDVISSAGDYFEGTNASLSWTLGEIAIETLDNGSNMLTQGFQQPRIVIHGINLDVLVFLEGPYEAGTMSMDLMNQGFIPLTQPYNVSPWNYEGTENVESIPADVVDWVLVELRDASGAGEAIAATAVETQAAFILSDGSVVGMDGSSVIEFTSTLYQKPYIIVWHRNHLGVLSANPPAKTDGIYSYDFSTSLEQAYGGGLGYKLIDTEIYGMAGGDVNNDGAIDILDKQFWEDYAGTKGYIESDINLDTQVNNIDKDDLIIENQGISSQVPD